MVSLFQLDQLSSTATVLFQHSEVIFWLSLYCVLSLRQLLENQMKYNINIQNLATC